MPAEVSAIRWAAGNFSKPSYYESRISWKIAECQAALAQLSLKTMTSHKPWHLE
jgi:hypothetical protein